MNRWIWACVFAVAACGGAADGDKTLPATAESDATLSAEASGWIPKSARVVITIASIEQFERAFLTSSVLLETIKDGARLRPSVALRPSRSLRWHWIDRTEPLLYCVRGDGDSAWILPLVKDATPDDSFARHGRYLATTNWDWDGDRASRPRPARTIDIRASQAAVAWIARFLPAFRGGESLHAECFFEDGAVHMTAEIPGATGSQRPGELATMVGAMTAGGFRTVLAADLDFEALLQFREADPDGEAYLSMFASVLDHAVSPVAWGVDLSSGIRFAELAHAKDATRLEGARKGVLTADLALRELPTERLDDTPIHALEFRPKAPPAEESQALSFRFAKGAATKERLIAAVNALRSFARSRDLFGVEVTHDGTQIIVDAAPEQRSLFDRFAEPMKRMRIRAAVSAKSEAFPHYWRAFVTSGKKQRDVAAGQRREEDKQRGVFARGLRWYPLHKTHSAPAEKDLAKDSWLLVEIDAHNVSQSDYGPLENAERTDRRLRFRPDTKRGQAFHAAVARWAVSDPEAALALIVGDEAWYVARIPGFGMDADFGEVPSATFDAVADAACFSPDHQLVRGAAVPSPSTQAFVAETEAMFAKLFGAKSVRFRAGHVADRILATLGSTDDQLRAIRDGLVARPTTEANTHIHVDVDVGEIYSFATRLIGTSNAPAAPRAKLEIRGTKSADALELHGTASEEWLRFAAEQTRNTLRRRARVLQEIVVDLSRAKRAEFPKTVRGFVFEIGESASGRLATKDPQDAWGHDWRIESLAGFDEKAETKMALRVRSRGPDGKRGTKDDIAWPPLGEALADLTPDAGKRWVERYVDLLKRGDLDAIFALQTKDTARRAERHTRIAGIMLRMWHQALDKMLRIDEDKPLSPRKAWRSLHRSFGELFRDGKIRVDTVTERTAADYRIVRCEFSVQGGEPYTTRFFLQRHGGRLLLSASGNHSIPLAPTPPE